jgi:hypothetical protein
MELNGQVELMLVLLIGEMFAFIIQDYVRVWESPSSCPWQNH